MHVEREQCEAKLWLGPVRLAQSVGFGRAELARIEHLVRENESALRRSWDAFFGE